MVVRSSDSLSQNFIKDASLVSSLLAASDINQNDTVIEIGPGKGIITQVLAKRAKKVIAVEKDVALASSLFTLSHTYPNLKIVNGDFLDFPLPSIPFKVFANIPFSLTGKIINKLLFSRPIPDSMYFLMQLEAAEKFEGTPHVTQSSLLAKPWYEVSILGDIDRTAFTQKPQIQIVFIEFKKRPVGFIKEVDKKKFKTFIIHAFSQWQPTALQALQKLFTYPQLKKIEKMHHLTGLKPTEVSFDTWLLLFKTYRRLIKTI